MPPPSSDSILKGLSFCHGSGLRLSFRQEQRVRADLATFQGVESLYAHIQALGRPVDAICINAGVGVGGPFLETPLEDELNLIALNVTSVVHLAKRVLNDMQARNEGRVLFTASIAAEMPGPLSATTNS